MTIRLDTMWSKQPDEDILYTWTNSKEPQCVAGSGQNSHRVTAKARLVLQGSQDIRHQAACAPSRQGRVWQLARSPDSYNQLHYL